MDRLRSSPSRNQSDVKRKTVLDWGGSGPVFWVTSAATPSARLRFRRAESSMSRQAGVASIMLARVSGLEGQPNIRCAVRAIRSANSSHRNQRGIAAANRLVQSVTIASMSRNLSERLTPGEPALNASSPSRMIGSTRVCSSAFSSAFRAG